MSLEGWSTLAQVVYARTYSRRDTGRNERWDQTVERVIGGNIRGHNVAQKEVERLHYYLMNRKCGPAGRGWWFSGAPAHARLGGMALLNCHFLACDDWANFIFAQDLLMLGGGVGMSVEHRFVSKLPRVKKNVVIVHRATKDADFIVPDSREGWNELLHRVLEAFFIRGKGFSYSTVCVRGAGESIHGFGGTASGPVPLIQFVEKICSLLVAREGKSVRPIDAADIICSIGEMVVAGNVRRSAIILLGDPWDKEYLKAKRWDLEPIPSQRSKANWSVVCDDVEDLHPLFWKTYEHGEAFGLFNRTATQKYGRIGELKKDTAIGVNPCQPAWATVLTPEGIREIGSILVGDLIWSGKNWTKVTAKHATGVKMVTAYHTRAGTFFGTENHRVVQRGEKIEVREAETIDTAQGGSLDVHLVDMEPQHIMDGLLIGDGMFHKASDRDFLLIGKDDGDYFTSEISSLLGAKSGVGPYTWNVRIQDVHHLPLTYARTVPPQYKRSAQANVMCAFLRGLYTANGSVVRSRVTLKAASKTIIDDVQEMLSALGIRSYYTVNNAHDVEFSNGVYECRESYDLNITTDRCKFARLIGFIQKGKTERLRLACETREGTAKNTYEVTEIKHLGEEEVFDLTVEDSAHTYWTGGLLVSNCGEAVLESGESCNLQNIALPNLASKDEFIEACRLMHRWGKRVALEKFHVDMFNEAIHRNMRIGTSITGCLMSELFTPSTLDQGYAAIQDENKTYSKELGCNESNRTTTLNPGGTGSKMFDMKGYEGEHPAYSRYIIQRVRFAANDPLVAKLREAGHYMEPVIDLDGRLDHGTLVVDFYERAPDGHPVADEDWNTWKQLDVHKMVTRHWTDQSASVTVYYKKYEIPRLKEWLSENLSELKTISFLAHSDHGFKQAPKEPITKEQYEKLSSKLKPVDFDTDDVGEGDISSMECQGGSCPVR